MRISFFIYFMLYSCHYYLYKINIFNISKIIIRNSAIKASGGPLLAIDRPIFRKKQMCFILKIMFCTVLFHDHNKVYSPKYIDINICSAVCYITL